MYIKKTPQLIYLYIFLRDSIVFENKIAKKLIATISGDKNVGYSKW